MELTIYVVAESRNAAAAGGWIFDTFQAADVAAAENGLNVYKATAYIDEYSMYEVDDEEG